MYIQNSFAVRRYTAAVHNSSIKFKTDQQKRGEAAMHASDGSQSSPTRLWHRHKVLIFQSWNLLLYLARHLFLPLVRALIFEIGEGHQVFVLLLSAERGWRSRKAEEMRSQAGKGRFLVPFSSSKGIPAVWGTGWGDWFEVLLTHCSSVYPKKPRDRLVSWRGTFCNKVKVSLRNKANMYGETQML